MNRNSCRYWIVGAVLALAGAHRLFAADPEPAAQPPAAAGSAQATPGLSVGASAKRAAWQQHLTLGPGDTLNISLFDQPDTARTEVPVGPDGRLSFLQARDVTAAGLTIDELRAKLEEALGKVYQTPPRAIVTPVVFRSKKYFVLGAVVNKGVYPLDRPVTIIEALARAGGAETGVFESRTVELADLTHSYLVRNGQRLPVDFEKLFRHGDLSQNVALEPNDYLYLAPASENGIYVLGEVANPGVVAFLPSPTVISAVASQGGFTTRAFRSRVLVVRGSLNHPETFVVDMSAVLAGKAPDFKLQWKDIVYVSPSPWETGAQIIDMAARAFVQSLVVEGTTLRMPPGIK